MLNDVGHPNQEATTTKNKLTHTQKTYIICEILGLLFVIKNLWKRHLAKYIPMSKLLYKLITIRLACKTGSFLEDIILGKV